MPDRLFFPTRCYAATADQARAKIRALLAEKGLRAVGEIHPGSDVAPQWCAGLGVTWWEAITEVEEVERRDFDGRH